jgi:hypothetical protein
VVRCDLAYESAYALAEVARAGYWDPPPLDELIERAARELPPVKLLRALAHSAPSDPERSDRLVARLADTATTADAQARLVQRVGYRVIRSAALCGSRVHEGGSKHVLNLVGPTDHESNVELPRFRPPRPGTRGSEGADT